jgi:hypothetical protein
MNNQLKLPWIQSYRETPAISLPVFVTAVLETLGKVKRQLRRTGQMRSQHELGRGYTEFVARHHQLR